MARQSTTNWDDLDVALTVPEAAKIIRIGINQMYQLAHSTGFPAVKVGGRIIVSRDGLRTWLNGGGATTAANDIADGECAVKAHRRQAAAVAPSSIVPRAAVQ